MSSPLSTVFSPGGLRHLAEGRSFERGAAYADAGKVRNLKVLDDEASATVRGTRQYNVRLWLEGGAPAFSCTCPVGEEGLFCKHCVAVGLRLSETDPATAGLDPKRPTVDLRRHLEGFDKSRLIDLLLEETGNDELLRGRLLLEAAKAKGADTDLDEYRIAIEDVLNPGG
ncbi:MAG TPA: SWIM zinc finger family protein, partial [Actinomycetota bacterium]|nr:SWIM zinc finger family protein [Actinomycetota bacterium]